MEDGNDSQLQSLNLVSNLYLLKEKKRLSYLYFRLLTSLDSVEIYLMHKQLVDCMKKDNTLWKGYLESLVNITRRDDCYVSMKWELFYQMTQDEDLMNLWNEESLRVFLKNSVEKAFSTSNLFLIAFKRLLKRRKICILSYSSYFLSLGEVKNKSTLKIIIQILLVVAQSQGEIRDFVKRVAIQLIESNELLRVDQINLEPLISQLSQPSCGFCIFENAPLYYEISLTNQIVRLFWLFSILMINTRSQIDSFAYKEKLSIPQSRTINWIVQLFSQDEAHFVRLLLYYTRNSLHFPNSFKLARKMFFGYLRQRDYDYEVVLDLLLGEGSVGGNFLEFFLLFLNRCIGKKTFRGHRFLDMCTLLLLKLEQYQKCTLFPYSVGPLTKKMSLFLGRVHEQKGTK